MTRPATDRPPFLRLRARSVSPVVLLCEHATHRLPFRIHLDGAQRAVMADHWGWDIGAWELTRRLSERLDSTAIGGRWSRLLIDLNRPVGDPTLILREAQGVRLPWNERLGPREIERRMVAYHAPYHVEVDRLILRRLVRGVRPLLVAVHSFTNEMDGSRRSFDFGVLFDDHRSLARRLARSLRDQGFSVRYNQPYSGMAGMMYSVERHGSHHRLPCLELEVNQALFAQVGAADRLGRAVSRAIQGLL